MDGNGAGVVLVLTLSESRERCLRLLFVAAVVVAVTTAGVLPWPIDS